VISISDAFRTALVDSHVITTRVEVYDNGVYVRNLPVHDGNVTVDYGVPIRRRFDCRLTVDSDTDNSLTPATALDLLSPFGNELRIYKGIKKEFLSGVVEDELVALGVFGIADVNVYDSGDGFMITLAGYDRSRRIARAKLVNDYVVTAGVNVAQAIRDLIAFRVPNTTFTGSASQWTALTTEVTPTPPWVFMTGDDPWEKALSMASYINKDLYFDVDGGLAIRTPPDPEAPSSSPDWVYQEGDDATILNLQRRFSDEHTFNHVVVTGERTGVAAPVRAEVKDDNSTSPTYYAGEYGDVVLFEQSSGIQTATQAANLAQARYARNLGIEETITFTCIANPAHDVLDIIDITRAKSKISARYQIDKITHPLIEERAMNIACRRRRI
jgi:hypothetical protein